MHHCGLYKGILQLLLVLVLAQTQITCSFVLIISLFNEKDIARIGEYIVCFEKNRMHRLIDTIHVFYDTSQDDGDNKILNHLQSKKIPLTFITGRASYGDCFALANSLYLNRKIIIANGDIFFNETLELLEDYDLSNKFLALTRWNVEKDGSLAIYYKCNGKPKIYSQDSWFFQSPLRKFKNDAIFLGTAHCDGRIAYQAKKSGLEVFNPCLSIQCCHLHLSDLRHYHYFPRPHKEILPLSWCELKK